MLGVDLDASYCQRAQSNLKTLDSFTQIRTRDDEGNYRYLTIEEKEEQRQQAMLLMEQYCD
jgi:arginine repressor